MRYAWATKPQSRRSVTWLAKKKKENKTRARQTKAAGVELEDFVNWTGVIANEPVEEEEMSSLEVGFAARMHKAGCGLGG